MALDMADHTKSHNVTRIKNPGIVFPYGNDMMNVENFNSFFGVGNHPAAGACEVVSFENCHAEFPVDFAVPCASWFMSKLDSKGGMIKIICKPVRVLGDVVIPVARALSSLSGHGLVGFLSKPFVPRLTGTKHGFLAVWVMPSFVLWGSEPAAAYLVDGERHEYLSAPALAGNGNPCPLLFGSSHISIVANTGKIEKSVNCWNPLRASLATTQPVMANVNAEKSVDWAISSQASKELDEGSTTRAWSPDRTVKPHERTAPEKGDDIV